MPTDFDKAIAEFDSISAAETPSAATGGAVDFDQVIAELDAIQAAPNTDSLVKVPHVFALVGLVMLLVVALILVVRAKRRKTASGGGKIVGREKSQVGGLDTEHREDKAICDIKFRCPKCKQPLEAPEDMRGQQVDCPACKKRIEVPLTLKDVPFSFKKNLVLTEPGIINDEIKNEKKGNMKIAKALSLWLVAVMVVMILVTMLLSGWAVWEARDARVKALEAKLLSNSTAYIASSANDTASEANDTASEANDIARSANHIARSANDTASEANDTASEANDNSEDALRIANEAKYEVERLRRR